MANAADYAPAGAFVAGVLFGALIVVRVVRAVFAEVRRGMRRNPEPPDDT